MGIPEGFVRAELYWHRHARGARVEYCDLGYMAGVGEKITDETPDRILAALKKLCLVPMTATVAGFFHEPHRAAITIRLFDRTFEEVPYNQAIPLYEYRHDMGRSRLILVEGP